MSSLQWDRLFDLCSNGEDEWADQSQGPWGGDSDSHAKHQILATTECTIHVQISIHSTALSLRHPPCSGGCGYT